MSLQKLRQESSDFDLFIDFIGLGEVTEAQIDATDSQKQYLKYTLDTAQTELLYENIEELVYAERDLRMLEINQRQYISPRDDLRSRELLKMPMGWYILIPTSIDRKNKIDKLADTGVEIQLKDVTFNGGLYKDPDFPSHTTIAFLYNGVDKSILVNPYQLLDYADIGDYGRIFINPNWLGNPNKEYVVFPLVGFRNSLRTLNYPNSFY